MLPLFLTFIGVSAYEVITANVMAIANPLRDHSTINLATIFENKPSGGAFAEQLINKWTYYCANISIGSPAQQFLVQLDTGSSELWVPAKAIKPEGFDPTLSSTFKFLNHNFFVRYIKDFAQGYWGMDTVALPGSRVQLEDQPFGIATNIPESTIGIMGLGPSASNSTSFSHQLFSQGFIRRNAFSVYLGDGGTSESGTILFGGKDQGKYTGLCKKPLKSNSSYAIDMDTISIGNYSARNIEVVLDTGTSLSYLPEEIVTAVAARFGGIYNPMLGMYIIPNSHLYDDLKTGTKLPHLTFQFGQQNITMHSRNLFWPLSYFTLNVSPYSVLTLVSNSQSMGINVLGSSFMRNAYVLFEPDMHQVQLGQFVARNSTQILAL